MNDDVTQRGTHIRPHRDDVAVLTEEPDLAKEPGQNQPGQLGHGSEAIAAFLQEQLGLTPSKLDLLERIAENGPLVPEGLEQGTARVLRKRGLVTRTDGGYIATEHGLVTLDQAEAIRIRMGCGLGMPAGRAGASALDAVERLASTVPPLSSIA